MLSREEYERITEEASTWAKAGNDAVRHERGGTTLSEILDASKPELSEEQEREYREKAWRRELYYARQRLACNLGEEGPDGFKEGLWLGLWSPSNYLDPTGGGYQQHDPDRTPKVWRGSRLVSSPNASSRPGY